MALNSHPGDDPRDYSSGDMSDLIPIHGWCATPSLHMSIEGLTPFVHVTLVHQETEERYELGMSCDVARRLGRDLTIAAEGEDPYPGDDDEL